MSDTQHGHPRRPNGGGQGSGSSEGKLRVNRSGIVTTIDHVAGDTSPATNHARTAFGWRSRLLAVLVAAPLATVLYGQLPGHTAAASGGPAEHLRVGHTVIEGISAEADTSRCTEGSACDRRVDVHVWYPADRAGFSARPKTVYHSRLFSDALIPEAWRPSWQVEAELAREDAPIDRHGPAFPAIVFSHGSANDPIDYAHTLESIAGQGFVVAAPYHVNNTQDDARIDFINDADKQLGIKCFGEIAPRCAPDNVDWSLKNRDNDLRMVLNRLPDWFGDRVDVSRAGIMGHSRGTITALAAAGGTADPASAWRIDPLADPHGKWEVRAIMGMAIGIQAVTAKVNLAHVGLATLLVAGGRDENSPAAVSEYAFGQIGTDPNVVSPDKAYALIGRATHRSFDSTYCAQLQAAAAAADKDGAPGGGPDGELNPAEVANWIDHGLDWHTARLIAASPGRASGKAVHYCSPETFTKPVWITPAVKAIPGSEVDPTAELKPGEAPVVESVFCGNTKTVPCTGLDTDEVKQGVTELATMFFGTVLKPGCHNRVHFTRYLTPKWLSKHVPIVDSVQAVQGDDPVGPPDQDVSCQG
jgi:predicted dienelactone hydrolase